MKMDVVNKCNEEDTSMSSQIAAFENLERLSRMKITPIQRFYTGANIFITGGTG